MAENRFSLWVDLIDELRHRIQDVGDLEKFTSEKAFTYLIRGIDRLPSTQGMSNNVLVPFGFDPLAGGGIDTSLYENYSNVTTDYKMALDVSTKEGYLESKAAVVDARQIALLTMFFVATGTAGTPVVDISLYKSAHNGEVDIGSWLVADGRIGTVETGKRIDVSMIPSSTFSFKITLPANSDYVVREMIAEMYLVDTMRMKENKKAIVASTAALIFVERAVASTERGASQDYIEGLYKNAEVATEEVRNSTGGGAAPTTGVSSLNSGVDRTTYASRAFLRKRGNRDGEWVEVTERGVQGSRVLRYIDR